MGQDPSADMKQNDLTKPPTSPRLDVMNETGQVLFGILTADLCT